MVGTAILAVTGFLRNRTPGATAFVLGNLAAFLYALGSLFEIRSTSEAQVLAALTLEYTGIATIGPFWFLTSVSATKGTSFVGWRNSVLLFVLPLVSLLMVATNRYHHLFYTDITLTFRGPFTIPNLDKGPFWVLNMIYMIVCLAWGTLVPLRESWKAPRAQKIPLRLLFFSGLIPVLGMTVFQFGLSPWGLDIAPFSIAFAAGVLAVALFKFRLFDLTPMVTDQVFANMKEGVLVVDPKDRVIGVNRAFADIFQVTSEIIGQRLGALGLPNLRGRLDVPVVTGSLRRIFQIDRSPLVDPKSRPQGEIFMLTDITQREELAERLARMARVDELTELTNRRGFLERLNAEVDRFHRYGRTPSLAIADLDHFKRINDTWGHAAGDAALVHVARVWTAGLRASDVLARYGGEEFIFLLPETTLDEAQSLLERLRQNLEESPVDWEGHRIPVTASFGVAVGTAGLTLVTVDRFISSADQALYKAKRSGRNCVRTMET